jgi:hypothetical protein
LAVLNHFLIELPKDQGRKIIKRDWSDYLLKASTPKFNFFYANITANLFIIRLLKIFILKTKNKYKIIIDPRCFKSM